MRELYPVSPYCPVINVAPAEFLRQLDTIEAGVWGTPCSVTLIDGSSRDVCLAWENKRYSDKGNWLSPLQVVDIRECDARMPTEFARQIWNAGESGMGYHIYVVELEDGASFVHVAGNLLIDLVSLPSGYHPTDIVNVIPHQGRVRSEREGYRQVSEYCSLEFVRTE